jgi:DNA topoisomerase-1
MSPAKLKQNTITIDAAGGANSYGLRASGTIIMFDGFMKLYPQPLESQDMPKVEKKEKLHLISLNPEQHFTQPPPRYSEGTLVKALEKFGIGRPSTYAPIMSTIQVRGYVKKDQNRRLFPTEIGYMVNDLLVEHFPEIVDINFTAQVEEKLDEIAEGNTEWTKPLAEFYWPFHEHLKKKEQEINKDNLIVPEITNEKCPKCARPMAIKWGRFGKFLACTGFPECKTTKSIANGIKLACPKCVEGEIVERRTKKGKLFYGCSRYPECDFASWDKPNGEKCPECAHPLVETNRGLLKCTNCKWKQGKRLDKKNTEDDEPKETDVK